MINSMTSPSNTSKKHTPVCSKRGKLRSHLVQLWNVVTYLLSSECAKRTPTENAGKNVTFPHPNSTTTNKQTEK